MREERREEGEGVTKENARTRAGRCREGDVRWGWRAWPAGGNDGMDQLLRFFGMAESWA